jgi:hypothetical protein
MAGPIRDLISMMRERRQQRREEGGGLFPRMRERMQEPSPEREERPGVRKLLRSLGVGSSRNDYLMQRKAVAKPDDRTGQDDAMGADMTYSRPYAGDGVDKDTRAAISMASGQSPAAAMGGPARVQATPASTKGAPGTITGPAPVTGDQNSLPDVPANDLASLEQQFAQQNMELGQEKDPYKFAAKKAQRDGTKALIEQGMIKDQLDKKDRSASFQYNMEQINAAAKQAVEMGEYGTLQALTMKALAQKNSAGELIEGGAPNVQEIVRPHARSFVAGLIGNKKYADMLPEEQFKLHRAISFAYPVTLVDPKTNNPLTPQRIAVEADRLYARLLADFPTASEGNRLFLRGLANVQVKKQAASLGVGNIPLNRNP